VSLSEGQRLRAVVAALPGDGAVVLGAFGGHLEARTQAALVLGQTYDFVVLATEPHIVLGAATPRAPATPGGPASLAGGAFGLPMATLSSQLVQDIGRLTAGGAVGPLGPTAGSGAEASAAFLPAVPRLVGPEVSVDSLQALVQQLGHNQEARVLRLISRGPAGGSLPPGELESLRHTIKARALEVLGLEPRTVAEGAHERIRAAERLVSSLNAVERDNVVRADHQLPQWVPLLASSGLREARWFLEHPPERGGHPRSEREFTAVLLLDFTRLGPVRVDVGVADQTVRAAFVVANPAAALELIPTLDELQDALLAAGLSVGPLSVRVAPDGRLPTSDLKTPPTTGEGLVDVRA